MTDTQVRTDTDEGSAQERIARLKALLAGRPRSTRTKTALGSPAASGASDAPGLSNLLLGVALHGAARLRALKPPTDLEMLLVEALGTVVTGAELREWGGAYQDTVQSTDPGSLVLPQLIASRPVSSGFTMADLAAVLPQLAAEAAAAPNVSLPTAEALAAGAQEDPAFLAAMRETGFAVTGVARHHDPAAAGRGGSWRVSMEMREFHVHRAVGDQGGGRDEIYFASSTSVGGGGRAFVSQEFGAVKKGQTRTFDTDKRVFVDERAGAAGTLVTHIQVWEADQSRSAWYDALQKALTSAIDVIERALNNPAAVIVDPIPLPVAIGWEIGKIFVSLMDILRNDDDLSCSRTIVLTRDDMAMLALRPEITWQFDGDGHHALTCRYTGERPVYPTGAIELVTRTHGATPDQAGPWSAPIPLGWKTTNAPRIATYRGALHAVFTREGDNASMWSRHDGRAWTTPVRINQTASVTSLALAVHRDRLHALHVNANGDGSIFHHWYDGTSWSRTQKIPYWATPYAPALTVLGGVLYCAHNGKDGRVNVAPYDDDAGAWGETVKLHSSDPAPGGPAFGAANGLLRVEKRNALGSIVCWYRDLQGRWTGYVSDTGWRTNHDPAQHHHGGYDWMFHAGTDGRAHLAWRTSNKGWNLPAEILSSGDWIPEVLAAPGLTVHDGHMYAIYHA
ncbi:hypothetical protein [Streptomyces nojiriensis]|uniref:hypothetical protein n=1 Tax=Streptomyces nojiriensis TaxID=66374 RepID=UPI0035DE0353